MPGPVQPEERARVRELHAAGKSRNEIARDLGRGVATITRIAKDEGLSFDRSETRAAVAAKVADTKARRAQLSADLLDDVQRLRERAWSQYRMPAGEDGRIVTLDLPPLGEVRNAYTSIGICVDKHVVLEKLDSDSGSEQARSMLGALAEGLQVAADRLNGTSSE